MSIYKQIACICIVLVIAFAAIGEPFAYAKSYTAYVKQTTYVYQQPSTSARKVQVKKGTEVLVKATRGSWAQIQNKSNSVIGYIYTKYLTKTKPSSSTGTSNWKKKVVRMNWFGPGKNLVPKGSYATLYDIDSKLSFRIKRMGGKSHMDVEPATAHDTAIFHRIVHGQWSWKSYAVILIANGKYVACGINAMPHGDQTIKDNNFNGQFCLHMTGSRTHETDSVNAEHQKSINRAYNWAHK